MKEAPVYLFSHYNKKTEINCGKRCIELRQEYIFLQKNEYEFGFSFQHQSYVYSDSE